MYPGAASGRGITDGPSDEKLGNCEQYDPVGCICQLSGMTVCRDYGRGIWMPRVLPRISSFLSMLRVRRLFESVLLFVCAGSMLSTAGPTTITTRWDLAKQVAGTVIDLLHFADAVTVMILGEENFNSTSEPVLYEASDENKAKLKASLEKVKPGGPKMTLKGLGSAFLTLRRAQSEQIKTTTCQQAREQAHGCPVKHALVIRLCGIFFWNILMLTMSRKSSSCVCYR